MQVNGKELAVEIDWDGPAVLLVHGLGGTGNFYQAAASRWHRPLPTSTIPGRSAPTPPDVDPTRDQ